MFVDYYEILEVAPDAPEERIRTAISQQRRIWVRRQSSADPERRTAAEQRVRDLDQAERTLLDPRARQSFDAERSRRSRQPPPSASSTSPTSPSRTPERQRTPTGRSAHQFAEETAQHWLERAQAYLDQGNTSAATRAAELAIERDRSDPEAWFVYGLAFAADDRPTDAALGFAEALQIEPDNPEYRKALGFSYLEQRKWRLAAAELEHVLRDDPSDARTRAGLGEAYIHTGNAKQGLAILEQVHAAEPDDEQIQEALATGWYEQAIGAVSEVDGGSPVVLSGRQLSLVSKNANKIRGLSLSSPRVAALEEELRSLSREARKPIWLPSDRKRYYLIGLILAVLMMALSTTGGDPTFNQTVGGVLVVLIVGTYVVRHRVPAWKIRRKDWARRVSKKGI